MFLISPLIIWPMWMKPTLGLIWSGLLAVVSIIIPTALTAVSNWPVSSDIFATGEEAMDYYEWNYMKPWCRFSPYIIGLILGYILHITKKKPIKLNKVSFIVLNLELRYNAPPLAFLTLFKNNPYFSV